MKAVVFMGDRKLEFLEFADPVPGPARMLTVMMTIVLDLARYGPD